VIIHAYRLLRQQLVLLLLLLLTCTLSTWVFFLLEASTHIGVVHPFLVTGLRFCALPDPIHIYLMRQILLFRVSYLTAHRTLVDFPAFCLSLPLPSLSRHRVIMNNILHLTHPGSAIRSRRHVAVEQHK